MTTLPSVKSEPVTNVAIADACESCGSAGMTPFYEIRQVPVHSVLLMPTLEQAQSYPRGDIRLAYCGRCGFVSNVLFDEKYNDYCQQYEETQGFSPTFSAFHRELARQLVERYDIRNKDVIEIGCGKGEFLALLCAEGGNRGLGFDPSFVPERGVPGLRVIQDLFSDKYASMHEADFVCCKMTMEHIASPRALVQAVRKLLDGKPNGLAFFQIPDFGHILEVAGFWDVYYEHCSYFTAASLETLFTSSGFEVLSAERQYDGQYLTIVARPASGPAPVQFRCDAAGIDRFARAVEASVDRWKTLIRDYSSAGKRVVLWGGGSKAVAFLSTVDVADSIPYVVDINPYRQSTYLAGSGATIVSPEYLVEYKPDLVVVMNPIYVGEIRQSLTSLGLSPEVVALGV